MYGDITAHSSGGISHCLQNWPKTGEGICGYQQADHGTEKPYLWHNIIQQIIGCVSCGGADCFLFETIANAGGCASNLVYQEQCPRASVLSFAVAEYGYSQNPVVVLTHLDCLADEHVDACNFELCVCGPMHDDCWFEQLDIYKRKWEIWQKGYRNFAGGCCGTTPVY